MPTLLTPVRLLLLSLCFSSAFSWGANGTLIQAVQGTAKLSVTLKQQDTQRSLANGQMTLLTREGARYTGQTNSQGKGAITGLAAGLYELTIERAGYQTLRVPSVRMIEGKSTPVVLTMLATRDSIEEVLVIGSASGGSALGSVSASTIDREALRSAAGSGGDVLRALDGLPGLFSDGQFSGFTVRGNGPRDNLVLVDGIPFANVVHFSDSFGELEDVEGGGRYSVFAPNMIGNAEFQPGGWSAAYGGRAGSLLRLEVAEGNPETPAYTARLDMAGIEIGYDGPSRIHDDTTLLLSARKLNFGRVFDLIGIEDIGEPELTDVIVKTRTELNINNTFKFLAIYAPESFTRDIDNVLASDEDDEGIEDGIYENIQLVKSEADNNLLAITWESLVGDSGEFSNQLYYRVYNESAITGEAYPNQVPRDTTANQIPVRFPITTSHREETEFGWRLDYAQDNRLGRFDTGLRVSQLELDFGLALDGDWIRYQYDQNDYRPSPTQHYIVRTPAFTNSTYTAKDTTYALYADQSVAFDRWDMRFGLRYDGDNLTGDSAVSPRLGASFNPIDKLRITTTAGRYLQSPLLNDRARDPSNTDLKYEVIDQVSVGFKYNINHLEVFFEPYYQRLSELVVKQDGVNQTYANTGEGTSYGFDTALTRHFAKGWSASATYSYNDTRLKDSPDGEEYESDFSRPHAFSLGGAWEISSRWKISGRYKWASGRLYDEYIIHKNVLGAGQPLRFSKENITQNTQRYDSYNSLNMRVDYRRSLGPVDVIAFLDIINVFGASNPSNANFNERTGENTIEDGDAFPLLGLRFEW